MFIFPLAEFCFNIMIQASDGKMGIVYADFVVEVAAVELENIQRL